MFVPFFVFMSNHSAFWHFICQQPIKNYFCAMKIALATFLFFASFTILNAQTVNTTTSEKAGNYYNEGTRLIGEKKFKEAIVEFDQAMKLMPNFPEALFGKGTCLLMLNQKKEACSCIENSAKMGYQPARNYYTKYCADQRKKN